MITIGITGTSGAGKGTIVEHLTKKYDFRHYSARSFIAKEVEKRGLPINRDNTTMVANDLRLNHHSGYIIEQLYKEAEKVGKNAIIESVRALGELEFLRKNKNFYLFAVDADPEIRYKRIVSRKSALDNVTFEKFLSDEKREMDNTDPTKGNIKACMKKADFLFTNNSNLQSFIAKIDTIMEKLSLTK